MNQGDLCMRHRLLVLLEFIVLAQQALPSPTQQQYEKNSTSFLVIGDYGYGGNEVQRRIATQMDIWAAKHESSLVISVGDNFYSPDGVSDVHDENWRTHWADIYRNRETPYLESLPWHAVLGNHDYCRVAEAQINYTARGWRMDDYFWAHQSRVPELNQTIAFVYLDTNLLAYGKETQPWLQRDCPAMREQFFALKWDTEMMIEWSHRQLEQVKNSDWIFVVGHHPIGGGFCGAEGELSRLQELLQQYRVSAYLNGHVHAMDYGVFGNVAHLTSGAGGDSYGRGCNGNNGGGIWKQDQVGAFVGVTVRQESVSFEFIDQFGVLLASFLHNRRTAGDHKPL